MLYTLQNEHLTVKISDMGAELKSCYSAALDCEYMWQGDPTYWKKTAPWLFPICSALYKGAYTYNGKEYVLEKHGFASTSLFSVEVKSDTEAVFTLVPDEDIKKRYPFEFLFEITYRLVEKELICELRVKNRGENMMYATVGGHPGFNVPLDGKGDFSDWYLEFDQPCYPDAVVFTPEFYDSGKRAPYLLEDSQKFRLSHDLFRIDGTFLAGMSSKVTLKSPLSARSVTVSYGDAAYVGVWSARNDGPYVCVEPWYGMASFDGVSAIEEKSQMFRLGAGEEKTVLMAMRFD